VGAVASRIRSSSVSRALELIGDRWTLLVLREAFLGVRRFEALRRSTGAPRRTLADRLGRLVEAGLLARDATPREHGRHEYHLTPKGLALYPVTLMIWRWERRWSPRGAQVPGKLRHTRCGRDFLPRLRCAGCEGEVDIHSTSYRDGPGIRRGAARAGKRVSARRGAVTLARRSSVATVRSGARPVLAHAIDLLGDRWTAQLISAQFFGLHRFDEMQRELGIATNVLSERLGRLVARGLLRRRRWQAHPPRYEYRLTAKGEALFPFTIALLQWADHWLVGPGREPLVLLHRDCGRRLRAEAVCGACGERLEPRDVRFAERPRRPARMEAP
jgi:DNA-binding HxlR family transcriptional regulator